MNPESRSGKLVRGTAKAFLISYGDNAFDLACHAAVPVVLTPELLHLVRVNFFLDVPEPLPYTVESDILLSPLCNEIGNNLYEIPPHTRDALLRQLATSPGYGEPRIREIAALLWEYSKSFSPWQDNQTLERGQQLTALNLLDSQIAKNWLEESATAMRPVVLSEREWFVAMRAELVKLDAVLNEPVPVEIEAPAAPGGLDSLEDLPFPFNDQTRREPDRLDRFEPLPFPFNQRSFSRYESIEKRIESIKVLVVDNMLRDEKDISPIAGAAWGGRADLELKRERQTASIALETILNNVERLVERPTSQVVHVSDLATAVEDFKPNAVVLGSTLRDFDYYKPELIEGFSTFIRNTTTPVLAIGGGHLLVGMSFGARVMTLDRFAPQERRDNRLTEFQYRFVRIVEPEDPIFDDLDNTESGVWQDYTRERHILRVWQNHELQLDRVPNGFSLLATSYLCTNQMMVRRSDSQLIYSVQFHLEKSFEDWNRNRTRWEHYNESRDGRILFQNFLRQALAHGG